MAEALLSWFNTFLAGYSVFIIAYFVAINAVYLILILFSFIHIRRQMQEKDVYRMHGLFASNLYNPISILAPAYNEEATVVDSVHSLLQLRFPNYEVIVINDGSKDRTMQVLAEEFELVRIKRYVPLVLEHKPIRGIYRSKRFPELIVVDKENGRKADALNAGINVCRNDLFCAIDADCVLEPDVLQNMLRCFIEDETTIAVGGIVRVANDCKIEGNEIKEIRVPKSYLARIQVVEYLRAFLFGRVGWDYLDSLLIISGAFGIFDRNAVLRVGGYLHDTVGEDMELVVRLHRYHCEHKIPYRVRFLPEPVCWTEVPEDRKVLARQRNRWQRGLADTLWRHRKMMFNPKYGRLGTFAMPFFLFFELLAPVFELFGYLVAILILLTGAVNYTFAIIILAAAVMLGMVLSIASVLCEEFTFRRYKGAGDVILLAGYAFLENFGYRQMHAWWRFRGIIDYLRGDKRWGEMSRKGFDSKKTEGDAQIQPTTDGHAAYKPQVHDTFSVSEGQADTHEENAVGDPVVAYDTYREKASLIAEKYNKRAVSGGDTRQDHEEVYYRSESRKWHKVLIPITAVIISFAGIYYWVLQSAGGSIRNLIVQPESAESELFIVHQSDKDDVTRDMTRESGIGAAPSQPVIPPSEPPSPEQIDTQISALHEDAVDATDSQTTIASPEITPTATDVTPAVAEYSGRSQSPVWDPSYRFMIVVTTLTNSSRAQSALLTAEELSDFGRENVVIKPSLSGRGNLHFHVGFGNYRTFAEARRFAQSDESLSEGYMILRTDVENMKVFSGTCHTSPDRNRYVIELGRFSSATVRNEIASQWQSLGFENLELRDEPDFEILTAGYCNYYEAELLADIIRDRTGLNRVFVRLR